MKVINSSKITPFGGLNFVLSEFEKNRIGCLIDQLLPALASQSSYRWKDILHSCSLPYKSDSLKLDKKFNFELNDYEKN